jgi:hypothetical protein
MRVEFGAHGHDAEMLPAGSAPWKVPAPRRWLVGEAPLAYKGAAFALPPFPCRVYWSFPIARGKRVTRLLELLGRSAAVLVVSMSLAWAEETAEPDWLLSDPMLARAIDAIAAKAKVDRDHDIPYVAGYSENGKTIYIDRDLPKGFTDRDKFIDTDRFLVLHEGVEKALIDLFDLRYQFALQVALRAERAAVAAAKIDWSAYDGFMQQHIEKIGGKPLTKVPADLDLRPYRDENDIEILARMKDGVEKSEAGGGNAGRAPAESGQMRQGRH